MLVRILDEARKDLEQGASFHEAQLPGLGAYFLDSLFSDVDSLLIYAGVHVRAHGFHRFLSRRFPFAVYYLVDNDVVSVYAVLDCRRNPKENREQPAGRRA